MAKVSGVLMCLCRKCDSQYDPTKSRGNWRGYCSRKCELAQLKWLGWNKKEHASKEWEFLRRARAIGDYPVIVRDLKILFGREPTTVTDRWFWNVHVDRPELARLPSHPNIHTGYMRFGTQGYTTCERDVADILRVEVRRR